MTTAAARVLGFLAALGAVFGLAFGVGRAVGPLAGTPSAAGSHADDVGREESHADGHQDGLQDGHHDSGASPPSGLSATEAGYTLRLDSARPDGAGSALVPFTVEGPDGEPVTSYEREHGKRLHLVAVRRDLTGYQHVHPRLGEDGTWSARLDLTPGSWRLLADFHPRGGSPLTLGADLPVAGRFRPAAAPPDTRRDRTGTYTVTVDGQLEPGRSSLLTFTVRRGGRPVTDLQPYLGASGHLVALREDDLAYLHVHPEDAPAGSGATSGPQTGFIVEVPSGGRYRLFLDFRHAGAVRTAELAITAGGTS